MKAFIRINKVGLNRLVFSDVFSLEILHPPVCEDRRMLFYKCGSGSAAIP